MNVTNSTQTLPKAPYCLRSTIIDDEYIAMDYFFSVSALALNVLTCPLTILLNTLVIIAVKTKPRLQSKHNILLASLAATDLLVGIAQPVFIVKDIILMIGKQTTALCTFVRIVQTLSVGCFALLSIFHLALIGLERYVAMKFSLQYESIVTETRLAVAVALSWLIPVASTLAKILAIISVKVRSMVRYTPGDVWLVSLVTNLVVIIFCHISVYFVSRRHNKQIMSEQVSAEAKTKFLEDRKAFKTTTIILLGIFLAVLPSIITGILMQVFKGSLAERISVSSIPLTASFFLFNSLYNPIVYCWRNKVMRQAIKRLLTKQ